MENVSGVGMHFSDSPVEMKPVGFMELLGVHHQDISRYALMQLPYSTPNSSSFSSASSEVVTVEEEEGKIDQYEEEDEQQQQKHKRSKRLKSTKRLSEGTKKMRMPKVSFITKSEINILDDGYKWRKYGQKPVRNSPFPRNYYRCTTTKCEVKKRVERSISDPSSVITTYEGQHTHPSPTLFMSKSGNFGSSLGSHLGPHSLLPALPPQLHHFLDHNHNLDLDQDLPFHGAEYVTNQEYYDDDDDQDRDHVMKTTRTRNLLDEAGLVKDNGLLQDVVSSCLIKGEYEIAS